MARLTKDQINVDLFDEVTSLRKENNRLETNIKHALQYMHDEVLNNNVSEDIAHYIRQLLTAKETVSENVCVNCKEKYKPSSSNSNNTRIYCCWECECEDRQNDTI